MNMNTNIKFRLNLFVARVLRVKVEIRMQNLFQMRNGMEPVQIEVILKSIMRENK